MSRVNPFLGLTAGVGIVCATGMLIGCSSTDFSGSNAPAKSHPAATPVAKGTYDPSSTPVTGSFYDPKTVIHDEGADTLSDSTMYLAATAATAPEGGNTIWVVTSNGTAKRIKLSKDEGYPITGTWTGLTNNLGGGHRTFVSEIGLIVGTTGVGIFRVSDDNPGTAVAILTNGTTPALDIDTSQSRVCTTAFKVAAQAYIGAAYYSSGGVRKFVRIPIDASKPNKVDVSRAEYFPKAGQNFGSGVWGYSCYTDQAGMKFYSTQANTVGGVNLTTGDALGSPGTSANLYALAGDTSGTPWFNGKSLNAGVGTAYTSAHEPLADVMVMSNYYSNDVYLAKRTAPGTSATFTMPTKVGPMSSLGDGRIIGLTRGTGEVWMLSLKDKNDFSKGLDVEKIKSAADIGGDPYMYTDFTAGTAYAATMEKQFDLTQVPGFDPNKASKIAMRWSASGPDTKWHGLILSARCYMKGAAVPAYAVITSSALDADTAFSIASGSCKLPAQMVDIKIEPDKTTNDYTRTRSIAVGWEQK